MINSLYSENNLAEDLLEARGVSVYKKRYEMPTYEDGNDYVWELCHSTVNDWLYCKKTELNNVANFWSNVHEQYENWSEDHQFGDWKEKHGCYLEYFNMNYLSKNEFISKRPNRFSVKSSDIEYLSKKLSKSIKLKQ